MILGIDSSEFRENWQGAQPSGKNSSERQISVLSLKHPCLACGLGAEVLEEACMGGLLPGLHQIAVSCDPKQATLLPQQQKEPEI